MFDPDSDETLDGLLQQWDERRQPSEQELGRLADRILDHSREWTSSDAGDEAFSVTTKLNHRVAIWSIVAIAAAILLIVAVKFASDDGDRETKVAQTLPPEFAWLGDDHLERQSVVLREMKDIFDAKLSWIVETADDVQLGVQETERDDPGIPIAVRIVVQSRRIESDEWTVAWAADVISESEESIHVAARRSQQDHLAVWGYVMPDGLIALDTELDLQGLELKLQTHEIFVDDTPRQVHRSANSKFETRVFQTVVRLPQEVG